MDDLLTTRQLENLLKVDRITIYRMLEDGRLKGFKVGGQWRFSRAEVDAWLQSQRSTTDSGMAEPSTPADRTPSPLPIPCVQAIQSVFAEALDIGAVTADMNGAPLTEISNACAFCDLVRSTEAGRSGCAASWRRADRGTLRPCHAGLLCGGARVLVSDKPVAAAVGCQFAAQPENDETPSWVAGIPALAARLGLDAAELAAAAEQVRRVPVAHLPRIARTLGHVADTFTEIGRERQALLGRLQRIAEITALE
ncbi:MAG: PocR ligand-binding domain-containing protein [Anaerolineae bacterium]